MSASIRALLSLRGLQRGPGHSTAVRVWLALWSHVRWPRGRGRGRYGEAFAGADTIAEEIGSDARSVKRALALLQASGLIDRRWRRRGGKCVKFTALAPAVSAEVRATLSKATPVVSLPSPQEIDALKSLVSRVGHATPGDRSSPMKLHPTPVSGAKPGPLLGLALAILAARSIECAGQLAHVEHALGASLATLRDMTDAGSAGHFRRRLDCLEVAGLIKRVGQHWGDGIIVVPVLTALVPVPASRPARARPRPRLAEVLAPRSLAAVPRSPRPAPPMSPALVELADAWPDPDAAGPSAAELDLAFDVHWGLAI
jgi:hypothetical protein